MKTGWQKITVHDNEDGKDDDYDYWFNFKSNGERRFHDKEMLLGNPIANTTTSMSVV